MADILLLTASHANLGLARSQFLIRKIRGLARIYPTTIREMVIGLR